MGIVKYKWFQIGTQLGISRPKLMEFKKEDDPLSRVINYLLMENVGNVSFSWGSIVKALRSKHVDATGLAYRIKMKYCQEEGNSTDDSEIHSDK